MEGSNSSHSGHNGGQQQQSFRTPWRAATAVIQDTMEDSNSSRSGHNGGQQQQSFRTPWRAAAAVIQYTMEGSNSSYQDTKEGKPLILLT
jgi:hypothetical protein